MGNDKKICVIGGDARYRWAADTLQKRYGQVETWGVAGIENRFSSMEQALDGADLVLLPMGSFCEEGLRIQGEYLTLAHLGERMNRGGYVFAGQFPADAERKLSEMGITCICYMESPDYVIQNAAITAECAVTLAMEQLSRTIAGENILVIGWGRIGKFLSKKLRALGAHVTVSVRRDEQMPELEALGYRADRTGSYLHELGEYGVIFNTVPAEILPAGKEREIRGKVIDLASLPGGFTPRQALALPVIMAQGLPGKMAPESAGRILAETIISALEANLKWLE